MFDVSWYCLVRWLSISNVLSSYFKLLDPIKQFMEEKGKSFPQLNEPQWLLDLAFFIDVVQYLQALNKSLQGKEKLISDLSQTVLSFHNKLKLFTKDLQTKKIAHFKCLKKISENFPEIPVESEEHMNKMSSLAEEINRRFNDLRSLKKTFIFIPGKSYCC